MRCFNFQKILLLGPLPVLQNPKQNLQIYMNIADKCLYRGTFYYQHFSRGILHGPQIIPLIYVTPQLFARLRVSRIISRVSERDPIQRMVDEFSRHKKKKKKKI